MRQSFYDRNDVPIFRGQARFVDDHAVSIDGDEPIRAKSFRDCHGFATVPASERRFLSSQNIRQRHNLGHGSQAIVDCASTVPA